MSIIEENSQMIKQLEYLISIGFTKEEALKVYQSKIGRKNIE